MDNRNIGSLHRANALILVGVDHRAHTEIGEDLAQDRTVGAAINDVDALHTAARTKEPSLRRRVRTVPSEGRPSVSAWKQP